MSQDSLFEFADCSEFRQTLAARPPGFVHGTALLLVILLTAAVTWSALVRANLVVSAPGRVRPVELPTRVFTSASGDLLGRVVEAPFEEGDAVRHGDILVRLDAARIDNRIAGLKRTLESSEAELARLAMLQTLLTEQLGSAKEKAQAEVVQAEATLSLAVRRRASEIRRAEAELQSVADIAQRNRKLVDSRVVPEQQLIQAESDLRRAQENLIQAKLPVDETPVAIARRAVVLIDCDFAVRRAELEARKIVKQGEAESARKDLANLDMQRREAVLRSPIDGVVVAGQVRPGDVLEPGKPVFQIARQTAFHFEAVVASADIGNLRVGMPVNVKFDAYDYQNYGVLTGTVTYLSPDSTVSSAKEGEPTAGTRSASAKPTSTFVVRVKMDGDRIGRGEFSGHVKLGLAGTAEIVVDQKSLLLILVQQIRQKVSLG